MTYKHLASLSDREVANLSKPKFERSGEKKFQEIFSSDKVDLIFVLDTGPNMEAFYETNPFGKNFLSQFKNYDWRFAYTDMSVDVSKYHKQTNKKPEKQTTKSKKSKKSCNFLSSLFMVAGGVLIGIPSSVSSGFKNILYCVSRIPIGLGTKNKKIIKPFTDGRFLGFEYHSKLWKPESKNANYLTSSVPNYNDIFHHSMTIESHAQEDSEDEDSEDQIFMAPHIKKHKSFPFLSSILSITQSKNSTDSKIQKESSGFFRKDSTIVYVLFSPNDFQVSLPAKDFKSSIKSFFGSEKRLKMISVSFAKNSSLLCQIKYNISSQQIPVKKQKFFKDLEFSSLDICSENLSKNLFIEISKTLYTKDFLKD